VFCGDRDERPTSQLFAYTQLFPKQLDERIINPLLFQPSEEKMPPFVGDMERVMPAAAVLEQL